MSILYIFAGNNGSGKSSFRLSTKDELFSDVDIDHDAIARNLISQGVKNPMKRAGMETIRQFNDCINKKMNFSIETTLSSKLAIKQIKEAKANNYTVIMYYLLLGDVELNINRVRFRYKQGGHDIPTEDIIRRHNRSRDNLFKIKNEINHLFLIDNSKRYPQLISILENGAVSYVNKVYVNEWHDLADESLLGLFASANEETGQERRANHSLIDEFIKSSKKNNI